MSEPAQKPGRSKQDYRTPPELLAALEARYGFFTFDLAASAENTVTVCTKEFFSKEDDALQQDWGRLRGNLWLNPPFANIEPWARKCASLRLDRARVFLLTPASIGSEWFARWVWGRALVLALRPRLTFVGCADPYPKDCIVSIYGERTGFEPFDWRQR